jgi:hypothetical protein
MNDDLLGSTAGSMIVGIAPKRAALNGIVHVLPANISLPGNRRARKSGPRRRTLIDQA